jgi:hypothetical protein
MMYDISRREAEARETEQAGAEQAEAKQVEAKTNTRADRGQNERRNIMRSFN